MKMKKLTAMLTAVLCSASTFAAFPVMNTAAAEAVHNDFEDTYNGWYVNSDMAELNAVDNAGYRGSRGMAVTGRTDPSEGAESAKGFYLYGGTAYTYSVKVKVETTYTTFTALKKDCIKC